MKNFNPPRQYDNYDIRRHGDLTLMKFVDYYA